MSEEGIKASEQGSAFEFGAKLAEERNQQQLLFSQLEARIAELEGGRQHGESKVSEAKRDVIILVHGIRDRALWQSQVRAALRQAGFEVCLTDFGRLDLFRFLVPGPFFRRSAINKVRVQINAVRVLYPECRLSVIAHSFGTYVISNVMMEEFAIVFHRVIFCGAVISPKIAFEQISNRFSPVIMNEIGTSDPWPALARSITWGYGSSGTFGYRQPLVEDRWHESAGHSFFLNSDFCAKYWVPFLKDGVIVSGTENPTAPNLFIRFISLIHLKYLVITFLAIVLAAYFLRRGT